jgi:SdpC family antimicrobial peptide
MAQQQPQRLTVLGILASAIFVLAVSACAGGDQPTAIRERLSGEKIFRGLILGEGPVAEHFPEVWPHRDFTLEERERRERTAAQLVEHIRQADPTFFDRFGAATQSGDHLRIERALDESTALVKQAVQERGLSTASRGERVGTCITVAAVVILFADSFMAVDEEGGESAWSGAKLGRDQFVEMVSTRLAAG